MQATEQDMRHGAELHNNYACATSRQCCSMLM